MLTLYLCQFMTTALLLYLIAPVPAQNTLLPWHCYCCSEKGPPNHFWSSVVLWWSFSITTLGRKANALCVVQAANLIKRQFRIYILDTRKYMYAYIYICHLYGCVNSMFCYTYFIIIIYELCSIVIYQTFLVSVKYAAYLMSSQSIYLAPMSTGGSNISIHLPRLTTC